MTTINLFMVRDKGVQIPLRSGVFLSSILFDCYDRIGHPATYSNPTGDETVSLGMVGFVDDCNGQTNSFHDEEDVNTIETLLHKTRTNMKAWSNLLTASGGALEMSKCSSHVLQWKFSMQGTPVLVSATTEEQALLTVPDTHSSSGSRAITGCALTIYRS